MTDLEQSSFLFLLGSSRVHGNTEALARAAAQHLPADTAQRWVHLQDLPLPPYTDRRHPRGFEFPEPDGNERTLLDATLAATDLVIASPLYWYSVSADTKLYLDYWTDWLRVPGVEFRKRMAGRTMWGITVMSDEEDEQADPLVGTLRKTAEYMGMRWGGVLIGRGNQPGDVDADTIALAEAKTFFLGRWARPRRP